MCIMMTPDEPKDTLLVLAPLDNGAHCGRADAGERWQLTYINTVGGSEVLMVVPIPNRHGSAETDFVLSAVYPGQTNQMRREAKLAFEEFAPKLETGDSFGGAATRGGFGNAFGAPPLVVQEVGAYQISVAPTLSDLESRAPWSRFPSAAGRVDGILADMRLQYPEGFAFVIAQSTSPVREAGFSIVYHDAQPFVPTAHEVSASPQHMSSLVSMDATIIAFNAILMPHSIATAAQLSPPTEGTLEHYPTYRTDDSSCAILTGRWRHAVSLLRALPVRGAGELHSLKLLRHARPIMACRWTLKGAYRNANVFGRRATARDVQALCETMDQLDAWLAFRTHICESALVPDSSCRAVPEPPPPSHQSNPFGRGFGGPLGAHFHDGGSPPFNHALHANSVIRRHGPIADFALVLEGRQLAYPGAIDRVSDAPASGPQQPHAPEPSLPDGSPPRVSASHEEMYLNLDVASLRGMTHAIDLDAAGFAHKDAPELSTLATGEALAGTVYLRISATPAPHMLPMAARTVNGRETREANGEPTASASAPPAAATPPLVFPAAPPRPLAPAEPAVGVPVLPRTVASERPAVFSVASPTPPAPAVEGTLLFR